MNHYKAQLLFISELGLQAKIFIEFDKNSDQTIDEIEEYAILLGYHQLMTDGFNLSPDGKDNLIFEKIYSLEIS